MDKIIHWFWSSGIDIILMGISIIIILITSKWIIEEPVKEKAGEWQYKYRLRKIRSSKIVDEVHYEHPLLRHLYFLIKTTSKQKKENDILSFMLITSLLFGFTAIIVFIQFKDIFFALLFALLVASIPYLMLQLRLRKIRYSLGKNCYLLFKHFLKAIMPITMTCIMR